jgi:hypothetical protein
VQPGGQQVRQDATVSTTTAATADAATADADASTRTAGTARPPSCTTTAAKPCSGATGARQGLVRGAQLHLLPAAPSEAPRAKVGAILCCVPGTLRRAPGLSLHELRRAGAPNVGLQHLGGLRSPLHH